ncbi:HlyD family efflux transporter periplasmic adaptor subunit [Amycolatopsis japonica]|uniref:HlyD family efflux transporter periplasmic adaptor subunit n=1 Tax=Amycolatopsis japonica TaxID=208439 RepID=UPI003320193F
MRFSRKAVESLESPEQLDEVARFVSVPVWLTTLAVMLVVAAVGVWSLFGSVRTVVSASGVLCHSLGLSTVDSVQAGQVTSIGARAGQRVERGQTLYTVADVDGRSRSVGAPWSGMVVSMMISEGKWLNVGDEVVTLERLDSPDIHLHGVVYVNAATASSLRTGMPVEFESPVAARSQFGTFAGVVSEVGLLPETPESLRNFLGPVRDVGPLIASGTVWRVMVELSVDPSTRKLNWSKAAPPFELSSQSEIKAQFTLSEERPINWLVR